MPAARALRLTIRCTLRVPSRPPRGLVKSAPLPSPRTESQASSAPRAAAPNLAGGIDLDPAHTGQVPETAPHGGELARDGALGELPVVEMRDPRPHCSGVRVRDVAHAFAGEERAELGEVGGVAPERVRRGAALEIEIAQEFGRRILHGRRLTPPRGRPLPCTRIRRECRRGYACRPSPPAPSGTSRRTSGRAR